MSNTLSWGVAHGLATISHLVMGIVGIVTFHNTAIQAFEDFMSGTSVGSSSIEQMGQASLLQGATAVVSQVPSQAHGSSFEGELTTEIKQGWVGFVFNLTYYAGLLWIDHKISSHNSRDWFFKRKLAVLTGVLVACGVFIGDITLASLLGVKEPKAAAGPIAASTIAG